MIEEKLPISPAEYIERTLAALLIALHDCVRDSATGRSMYTYQTIAQMGKVIMEGAKMLDETAASVSTAREAGLPRMTSPQMLELVRANLAASPVTVFLNRSEDAVTHTTDIQGESGHHD